MIAFVGQSALTGVLRNALGKCKSGTSRRDLPESIPANQPVVLEWRCFFPSAMGQCKDILRSDFSRHEQFQAGRDCRRNGFKIGKSSLPKHRFARFRKTREVSAVPQAGSSPACDTLQLGIRFELATYSHANGLRRAYSFSTLIAHQPLVHFSKLKRRSFYPFDVSADRMLADF
jgi:hypothetical protein